MDLISQQTEEIWKSFILYETNCANRELDNFLENLFPDPSILETGKQKKEVMDGLTDALTRLVEAQQNKDYLYVADILRYELKPILLALKK